MRLIELQGTKRHNDRSFWDVLSDFQQAGGEHLGSGRFSQVVGHPSWPYVLKVFAEDDCYLAFVEWAQTLQHPCLPRFFGKPRRIVPFWARTPDNAMMWVVKQERLEQANAPYLHDQRMMAAISQPGSFLSLHREPDADLKVSKDAYARKHLPDLRRAYREARKAGDEATRMRLAADLEIEDDIDARWEMLGIMRREWRTHPELFTLMEFVFDHLSKAPVACEEDWHAGNIMRRRSDGNLVLVDPFWHGESPLAMHDRIMRAEIPPTSDEPEMLRGRQTKLPPKPWAEPLPISSSDIPF